ncbi:hypothetical protein KBY76_00285 [Synechococcus sp. GreenBA-s]|nr:hypothetical protein [Synechococcus sp. GreenBA-s]
MHPKRIDHIIEQGALGLFVQATVERHVLDGESSADEQACRQNDNRQRLDAAPILWRSRW